MSSEALVEGPAGMLAAGETAGQVWFARMNGRTPGRLVAAPGGAAGRKHPAVAGNARGETLLVWTEGTGWQKGGSLAWQVFDRNDRPTGKRGRLEGAVPVWGLAAAAVRPDGGFTVVY